VMIAAIHPARPHTDESISTCRFAQRVAKIKNQVSRNEEMDPAVMIARLKEENRRLKEAGALHEDDGGTDLTEPELKALRRSLRIFLRDPAPAATIDWGRGRRAAKVRHAFWMLKAMLQENSGGFGHAGRDDDHLVRVDDEQDHLGLEIHPGHVQSMDGEHAAPSSPTSELRKRLAQANKQLQAKEDECAKLRDRLRLLARTPGAEALSCKAAILEGGSGSMDAARDNSLGIGKPHSDGTAGATDKGRQALSRIEIGALRERDAAAQLFATAFERGAELAKARAHAQDALRPKLEAARNLGAALVVARDEIASVKAAVEARRVHGAIAGLSGSGNDNSDREEDEEELRLVGVLQEKKNEYKAKTAELKHLKMHVGALQARCQATHAAFEGEFIAWWNTMREVHGLPALEGAVSEAKAAPSVAVEANHDVMRSRGPVEAWPDKGLVDEQQRTVAENRATSSEGHGTVGKGVSELSLSLLRDPASALDHFRSRVWSERARNHREGLKAELGRAVAQAKDSGEMVSRRRARIGQLKDALATAAANALADESDGAPSDSDSGQAAASLRGRLEMEKESYKEDVATLRELKQQIESLQAGLDESQRNLQADFMAWHGPALARAEEASEDVDRTTSNSSAQGRGGARHVQKMAWS